MQYLLDVAATQVGDEYGNLPVHLAAWSGDISCLELVMEVFHRVHIGEPMMLLRSISSLLLLPAPSWPIYPV